MLSLSSQRLRLNTSYTDDLRMLDRGMSFLNPSPILVSKGENFVENAKIKSPFFSIFVGKRNSRLWRDGGRVVRYGICPEYGALGRVVRYGTCPEYGALGRVVRCGICHEYGALGRVVRCGTCPEYGAMGLVVRCGTCLACGGRHGVADVIDHER